MLKNAAEHGPSLTNAGKMIITGNGLTGGSVVWAWLGSNNEQITAVCAILGAVVAISGLVIQICRVKK